MRNNITIKGQWMYLREAMPRLIAMVRSGSLDLTCHEVTEFRLASIADAIAHSAKTSGPFTKTVLRF